MQKNFLSLPEIKLIGLAIRTSYSQEIDKTHGRILPCVQKYFHQAIYEKIPHRKKPGTTLCVYTDYESDYKGAYTYFIGEEVETLSNLPEGMHHLIIPAQRYAKFTTPPEPMPEVIIHAWQAIWKMTSEELGGKRLYQADFEVYDERAADHQNIVLDAYVGID